jgi:hypothetical protein
MDLVSTDSDWPEASNPLREMLPDEVLRRIISETLDAIDAAEVQATINRMSGKNCTSCGDALGDNLGPECPSCIELWSEVDNG